MSRWIHAAGTALVLAVTVGLAMACGDGGSSPSTSPTTTLPEATTTTASTTTTTVTRAVALCETFSVRVGESVSVAAERLFLQFKAVASDSRCRPGQRCIVAGDAFITVALAKDGMAPASLTISAPGSARYGRYTVEVVQLGFGPSPNTRIRVV